MMETVLLVEDNPDDIFFVKRAFKANRIAHPLQVVEDGQAAIDYLSGAGEFADRDEHPLPFLILLDLKLPQRPGLEVLEWMRGRPELNHLIVVVLTSSHLDVDITRAYELGAHSFLVKPPDARELTEMIGMVDKYWLQMNRPPPPPRRQERTPPSFD
jgi:CheY-like chemotaxis protein